jgi:predicted Zn-dependent peptidase
MTSYTAGGDDLDDVLEKLACVFNSTVVSEEYVQMAKDEITKQTKDVAPLVMRRMKLLYKHTGFGADTVVSTEEYLEKVNAYTVEDVRAFANKYYTASNVVLSVSGPRISMADLKDAVEKYFAGIPKGNAMPKAVGSIYTGGFGRMDVPDTTNRLMFGWDVSWFTLSDSPTANVMMSMFWRRVERAYADLGLTDVQVEFKIAGYYGLRTVRALITSPTVSAKKLTEVFLAAVNRICDTEASEQRMEKSRNAAMVEKLDKYEKSDDKALEMAWQMIGRGSMYNVASRINSIWETTAHDVRILSREVFRNRPTYIAAVPASEEVYSYKEVMETLGIAYKLKENEQ